MAEVVTDAMIEVRITVSPALLSDVDEDSLVRTLGQVVLQEARVLQERGETRRADFLGPLEIRRRHDG